MLKIKDLSIKIGNGSSKTILKDINLSVEKGEVHVIMGPNGSGKTSLLYAIMGHPDYQVIRGDIIVDGKSIKNLSPDKRSLMGIFLTFQSPIEIPGVKLSTLMIAMNNKRKNSKDLLKIESVNVLKNMKNLASDVGLGFGFLRREVNKGFSGGERKKSELLQAIVAKPKYLLLDEPDTGLDVDSVKNVSNHIEDLVENGTGVLLVTHYARILSYISPSKVSVIVDGRIVESGNIELANEIEKYGYKKYGVIDK